MKFMIDSNIFDQIVESEDFLKNLKSKVTDGSIEIFSTPVQEEELGKIPKSKAEKSKKIREVPRKVVPLVAFVLGDGLHPDNSPLPSSGQFILGASTLASDEDAEIVHKIQNMNLKRTADGLIAATAASHVDVLVTNDWKGFAKKVEDLDLEIDVWDFDRFNRYIETH